MKLIALLAFAAFILASSHRVTAEPWPQYRGPAGDGVSTASISDKPWGSSGPKVLWKAPTPLGFSSFAVADGRAITLVGEQEHEVCLALDANTGKKLWEAQLGSIKYGRGGGDAGAPDNRGGDGPRGTPTISGDRVFAYDAFMTLHCLDAETGQSLWKRDIEAEFEGRNIPWRNASSPIVDGNSVIVGGGGAGQSFLAFNKDDGQVLWKSGDETITHATPCLAEINDRKQIVFFVTSGLVAVDVQSGEEIWRAKFPFSTSTAASPVVEGDRVYCSAGYGVGAGLFKVTEKAEATELWFKANELMNHWSTPVVHDGHLYGIFEFKKYGRAPLQCVNLATGEIKWKKGGFGPGNCIQVGNKIVALSDAGEVVIVSARPDEYVELARADVVRGKCWSTPAFSNGRLYVRSTEEAACIDLQD
ncbi:PQQ-binding-like beta-propeller repeat protein [Rubripirellula amarantea]|nr:PQQ-binding-like beta-propeller repeat protein [Rubripirellula amarantea]